MLHVCQLSVSQPGILPTPAQPDPDGGVCEALALEETLLSLLSSAAVSSSFLLCALFQKVKNMAPAIGGWDSARETQMSGDRKVQPVSSSFWFKDSGQLSSQCFFL